jgi:benzodiazapine receptor
LSLINKIPNLVKAVLAIAIPLAVGAFSGMATAEAIPTWYAQLQQPSFNPPNWIFGPVWSTLYLLMGISLFLIWKLPTSKQRNEAIAIFFIQMVLNSIWSFLFFYFKRIDFALIEIVILWGMILLMILRFYKLHKPAGLMNIPYLMWVSFATILNAAYYYLN